MGYSKHYLMHITTNRIFKCQENTLEKMHFFLCSFEFLDLSWTGVRPGTAH